MYKNPDTTLQENIYLLIDQIYHSNLIIPGIKISLMNWGDSSAERDVREKIKVDQNDRAIYKIYITTDRPEPLTFVSSFTTGIWGANEKVDLSDILPLLQSNLRETKLNYLLKD